MNVYFGCIPYFVYSQEPIAMMMLPPIAHYGSNNDLQDMHAEFSGESSRQGEDRVDVSSP